MPTSPGRLEVICGPMFAGKTTELVRRLTAAHTQNLRVLALKPARDTRYSVVEIKTHTGESFPATPIPDAAGIISAAVNAQVLAIDEIHFFGTPLIPIVHQLIAGGTRIIVAGVERDHRGIPFEPFPHLLCEADEVIKLSGKCAVCGGPSVHSQRMIDSADHIVVGGADMYQPRCRACFKPGR